MARKEPPLKVQIPRPGEGRPIWSRVGLIGAAGFVIGIVWPRIAGIDIGPDVPEDAQPKPALVASAAPSAAPVASAAPAAPAASAGAAAKPANGQLVKVGPGRITRCSDQKGKKVDDCGELQFDPVALPRLEQLADCPAALGLDGKLSVGFEIDFKSKEVQVVKGKRTTLPTTTTTGVLACAAREFSKIELDEVPHQHRKYTLFYTATFYPPGKHPVQEVEDAGAAAQGGGDAAGSTTSESQATGLATISWDTALLRKTPKDGDVVARIVRGTRVKIVGRQNDWYRVDAGAKTGWVYRGAIGL